MNLSAIAPYSNGIINLINGIFVPVLFAVAFLYFVYGVYKYYILGADSESERQTGHMFILWSLVAFAVILSVWGLVKVLTDTLNIPTGGQPPSYPTL